ncbi:MAG TPA: encapsulin, partial [Anaeromyxobacter sp.]|nr:encapsulin [Anaeromyxobacter sp.]
GGIVKAPVLADGAIVVMRSPSGPRAVLGQELSAGYDGRDGIFHQLSLVESITLLPGAAGSVAILRGRT